MKLRNKLTSLGATVLVVSLLAACSGAAPEDDPVLGAPPGVSVTNKPTTKPENETDNYLPPIVEGDDEIVIPSENDDFDPRAQDKIFDWTPEDLAPLKKHKEAFSAEDADTVMIDTMLMLQTFSSFSDYQNHGIPANEIEILANSFTTEEMTEKAVKNLTREMKEETALAMMLIPHRIDGSDAHDRVIDFDDTRAWDINYTDLEAYDIVPPGESSDSPQAPFSLIQTMQIPDKSGDVLTIRTKLTLTMEPGFDKWVLDDWSLKDVTAEWSSK